ncbi:MAG: hypothetical protein E7062_05390 [Spirochaetaceae bacterium]|nr:hypothetical protein [Spirochaetaceae bacterium]
MIKNFFSEKKRTLLSIILINLLAFSWSASFSTEAGIVFDIDKLSKEVPTSLDAFFQGQFNLTQNIFLRSKLSIETENLFSSEMLQNIPSTLNIDELSLTYAGNLGYLAHYISAFLGNYENLGNDAFLQRQFGIPSINSRFLLKTDGTSGVDIFSMSGIGLSYLVRMPQNNALGFYAYYNYELTTEIESEDTEIPNLGNSSTSNSTGSTGNDNGIFDIPTSPEDIITTSETRSINFDIRYGTAKNNIVFDCAFGVSLPLEDVSDDEDVILLIRRADLHGGFSVFFGNTSSSSLLLQAGISKLRLKPNTEEKVLSLSDLFILLEPKFVTKKLVFAFTLFNIPEKARKNLYFVDNPLGVNVAIYSNNLLIRDNEAALGIHCTLSMPETSLELDFTKLGFALSPFFEMDIASGKITTVLQTSVLEVKSFKSFLENTKLSLSYKVLL